MKAAAAGPRPRRRQGRHLRSGRRARRRRRPARGAARLRRPRRVARRPLHHRRGRRRLARGHGRDGASGPPTSPGCRRERGGSGDPSPFTAIGVEAAMRACVRERFGESGLEGRRVVDRRPRPRRSRSRPRWSRDGARADRSPTSTRPSARSPRRWARVARSRRGAHVAECDVLAPCALGGAIDAANVGQLRCEIVCGAANNQLADEALADELARARHPRRARLHRQRRRADQRLPRDQGLRRRAGAASWRSGSRRRWAACWSVARSRRARRRWRRRERWRASGCAPPSRPTPAGVRD